jgi:hypothetical protein
MSLSALSPSRAGGQPPVGGDWDDSRYGSLATLGPRTFKKKPVLMLDAEELAKAHLAIAMGGAEIMETMPDPVEAPRPRQPSMLLGLVPMGAEEAEEDLSAYPAAAAEIAAAEEWDEPEEDEADEQTWTPEDEPDEDFGDYLPLEEASAGADDALEAAPPPVFIPVAPAAVESAPPSIEEQLERMRERLARRTATAVVPTPAVTSPAAPAGAESPVPIEAQVPTIRRIEIDDWSHNEPFEGVSPPQERVTAPVDPVHETSPEPVAARAPDAIAGPAPEPIAAPPEPAVADSPVEPLVAEALLPSIDEGPGDHEPADLLDLGADLMADETPLDVWQKHAPPVVRRASPIRERLRDSLAQPDQAADAGPSLLSRLWIWLRGRF